MWGFFLLSADTEDVCIVERLFSSSLVAIVSLKAPRKLKVCHFKKGTEICNYSYSNTILAVKLNRQVGRALTPLSCRGLRPCLRVLSGAPRTQRPSPGGASGPSGHAPAHLSPHLDSTLFSRLNSFAQIAPFLTIPWPLPIALLIPQDMNLLLLFINVTFKKNL